MWCFSNGFILWPRVERGEGVRGLFCVKIIPIGIFLRKLWLKNNEIFVSYTFGSSSIDSMAYFRQYFESIDNELRFMVIFKKEKLNIDFCKIIFVKKDPEGNSFGH